MKGAAVPPIVSTSLYLSESATLLKEPQGKHSILQFIGKPAFFSSSLKTFSPFSLTVAFIFLTPRDSDLENKALFSFCHCEYLI
jgi:hypothetical protein